MKRAAMLLCAWVLAGCHTGGGPHSEYWDMPILDFFAEIAKVFTVGYVVILLGIYFGIKLAIAMFDDWQRERAMKRLERDD